MRQLWDWKARLNLTTMNHRNLTYHGALRGWALAAHARSGDAVQIAGNVGRRDTFDRVVTEYTAAYSATTEHDHAALVQAVANGRVEALTGI